MNIMAATSSDEYDQFIKDLLLREYGREVRLQSWEYLSLGD